MAETLGNSGVFALSWRFSSEPQSARHWAYYLSSDEIAAAIASADDKEGAIVVRSMGWLSVDDMLVAS